MQEDGGPLHQTTQHSTTYNAGGWGAPSTTQYNKMEHAAQEGGGRLHHKTQPSITYNIGGQGPLHHTIQFNATYDAEGWGPPPPYNPTQYNTT